MIKAVFFDALHTLFESNPSQIELYQSLLKKYTKIKVPTDELEHVVSDLLVKTEISSVKNEQSLVWGSFWEQVLDSIGYKGDDVKSLASALRRETWDNPYNYNLFPDVIETLTKLSLLKLKIACVSNEDIHLNNFFIHFDIDKYFDFILVSEEVGCEKPNKLIFEKALEIAKLEAKDIIFVGDSYISDYEGPESIGIKAILIDRENTNEKKIDKINKLNDIVSYIEKENYANTAS